MTENFENGDTLRDFPCPRRHIFHGVSACISEFDSSDRKKLKVRQVQGNFEKGFRKPSFPDINIHEQDTITRRGGNISFALRRSTTHLIIGR